LDVFEATHTGINNDNMPGIVNGRLHFLIDGDTFDLSSHYDLVGIEKDPNQIPENFRLFQNYPNPFNPITTLRYDLPENAMVNISIYDMMGRIVNNLVNSQQNAGYKSIQWNATNDAGSPVSAGLYLYMIKAGEFTQTRKMVLLK
jgi:hypothetical protein